MTWPGSSVVPLVSLCLPCKLLPASPPPPFPHHAEPILWCGFHSERDVGSLETWVEERMSPWGPWAWLERELASLLRKLQPRNLTAESRAWTRPVGETVGA